MSKITKLSIMGVRSFDNKRPEVIEFFTPLTLIVGLNGSGKTTIIECLRYAATGELPPNSAQSGAWIHDPKLCGEREVLAQVKLAFESTSGTKMVATRSLQLTLKKTVRSQKSLEGQLMMYKNGERTSISSRIAELDAIMPQYLGVSKAILESVIFCHQEDSLWPMSQPAVLKKKFDEIFEAMKYTKAIENIKVLRKKHKEDYEKLKIVVEHAKENKNKGAKVQQKSIELDDELDVLREKERELKLEVDDATAQAREAWDHAARFEAIVVKLQQNRIAADEKERSLSNLRKHMQVMSNSDEELQNMEDRYEERVQLHRKDREIQGERYRVLLEDIERARRDLGVKQSEVGKYQAQKDQHERQLESRQNLVKESARRHNIRGFDVDITDPLVHEFMERLSRVVREKTAAADRDRQDNQEEAHNAQRLLSGHNERRSALVQKKDHLKAQIAGTDRRLEALQKAMDSIEMSEGSKAVMQSTVEDTERKLSKLKHDAEKSGWDLKLKEQEDQLRKIDLQKDTLDAELLQATKEAGDSARLDFVYKELANRRKMQETNLGAHRKRITDMLGSEWSVENLESAFQARLQAEKVAVKDAELQRDGVSREVEQLNFQLRTLKQDLNSKREDVEAHEDKLHAGLEGELVEEYESVVRDAESRLENLKLGTQGNEAMKSWYKQALDALSQSDCCRLCRRTMRSDRERKELKNIIEKALNSATDENMADDIKEAEQWLADLRALRPSYEVFTRLEAQLPALETEAKDLGRKRDNLNNQLESLDQKVQELEAAYREVDGFSKTIHGICKTQTEIRDLAKDLEELERKQKTAGHSRGLESIQTELRELNEKNRGVNAVLAQLRTEKERAATQINTLELEVRDLRSKLATALHQLRERSNIELQMQDLKSQNQESREAIKQTDTDIEVLVPQVAQAQAQYDDAIRRGNDRAQEHQRDLSKLNDSLHKLKVAEEEINAYVDRGGAQQLSRAHREMSNVETEISSLEEEQRQVTKEIKAIDNELASQGEMKRAISDNLLYRQSARLLRELQDEIKNLASHNAEEDKARYEREASHWQERWSRLSAEHASLMGTMKVKDDQLAQMLNDWNTEYKDSAQNYKTAHIKVETTKACVEDLARFGNALDQAVMKFHSVKMEEINKIIEELWQKTYQGTDVDTIQIKSENETAKGNKSYNYRVIMKKQDAEMDMRGRCSAGQKVLASIIIRLALAECFGVNCGLIALDEPTTNLDRDNIRALAESLAEIIKIRRAQSNFQLIVITHDEEFLRQMGVSDFVDSYYRVSRSSAQKSCIEQQSVAEVM